MFINVTNPCDEFLFTTKPYFSVKQDLATLQTIINYRQRIAKLLQFIWEHVLQKEEKDNFIRMIQEQQSIREKYKSKQIEPGVDKSENLISLEEALHAVYWEQGLVNSDACSWKSHSEDTLLQEEEGRKQSKDKRKLFSSDFNTLPQALCFLYNNTIATYFKDQKISCSLEQLTKSMVVFKRFIAKKNDWIITKAIHILEKQEIEIDFFVFGRKIDCEQVVIEVKKELKRKFKDKYTERGDLDAKWEHVVKSNLHSTKVNLKWEIVTSQLQSEEEVNLTHEQNLNSNFTHIDQSQSHTADSLENSLAEYTSTQKLNDNNNLHPGWTKSSKENQENGESETTSDGQGEPHAQEKESDECLSPIEITSNLTINIPALSTIPNTYTMYNITNLESLFPQYPVKMSESKKRKRIVSENDEQFFSLKRFTTEERIGKRRLIIPKEHLIPDELLSYLSKSNTLLHRLCNSQLQQQLIDIDKAYDRKKRLDTMMKNFPELEQFLDEALFVLGEKEFKPR